MREAAVGVISTRAGEVMDHAHGILDVGDIERVHDMRVATRRLRAALEVFEVCFPRKQHRRTLKEVKALADALGERRDRDVAIASLEEFGERLAAPDRPGVASLVLALRREQADANRDLEPAVAPGALAALRERVNELVLEARA